MKADLNQAQEQGQVEKSRRREEVVRLRRDGSGMEDDNGAATRVLAG